MRTDGVTLSGEAIAAAREVIAQDFGASYVPTVRAYTNNGKERARSA